MKTILLSFLFTSIFFLTSCNNNDSHSFSSVDPIIGKWQLYKYYKDGIETDNATCNPTTEEYKSTNNLLLVTHYESNANLECIAEQKNYGWLRSSENIYKMLIDGVFVYRSVIFENGNNTLIYEESETDNNGNFISIRFVFHRLN